MVLGCLPAQRWVTYPLRHIRVRFKISNGVRYPFMLWAAAYGIWQDRLYMK